MSPSYLVPEPVYLYHITHIRNLPAILAAGGLTCYNTLRSHGSEYHSIAYTHIQERRALKHVPCGPGGTLHDYVPFYFGPRSPMLYAIHRGRVAGYSEGQPPILHLLTTTGDVQTSKLPFVFTNGHGITEYTRFFTDLKRLDQVDFSLMRSQYWYDTDDDPNRIWRRNAEFLVFGSVPWKLIRGIGVIDDSVRVQVEAILCQHKASTPVRTRHGWYY